MKVRPFRISPAARQARLRRQGFDRTHRNSEEGTIRVGCSQCEALVINGVAVHETGCPNARRAAREDD